MKKILISIIIAVSINNLSSQVYIIGGDTIHKIYDENFIFMTQILQE
jgi:hypothetical protein